MATEQQLRDALIEADSAGDFEAAKLFASEIKGMQGSQVSPIEQPMQQVQQPAEEKGFLDSVGEFFTGSDRETRATEELPELQGLFAGEDPAVMRRVTAGLLTATNPQEMAKIITSNLPHIGIQQDEKGNLIGGNNRTGAKAMINKPGASAVDFIQAGGLASAFALGPTTGAIRVAAGAGGVSAGIEGLHELVGGDFNIEQVAMDAVTAGVLDKAFQVAKATGRKIQDVLKEQGIDPKSIIDKIKGVEQPNKFGEVSEPFVSHFARPKKLNANEVLEKARANPDLTPEAMARMERAKPITQLTRAQATKDFSASQAEDTLKGLPSIEGQEAREFAASQQKSLQDAATQFTDKFGGSARLTEARRQTAEVTARDKGEFIQGTISGIKESKRKEAASLYKAAEEEIGEAIPLNNAALVDIADEAIVNLPVTDATRNTLDTALAKFGLIGDSVEKSTRNLYKVMDGQNAITIKGEVTPLTLSNTEQFRQAINKAAKDDVTGSASGLIRELDNQIEQVLETGVKSGRSRAFELARNTFRENKELFNAKDIIEDLSSFKKGTSTSKLDPEQVIKKIAFGEKSVTNVRRVKEALLKDPTEESRRAWKSIQSESIGDIFSQAINKDTLEISGPKFNTAIKSYKPEALKELLGDKNYKELLRIQEVIGDVTIPPPRTTNPSGTATKIFAMLENMGNFGQFNMGTLIATGIKKGKEISARKAALNGMVNNKIKTIKTANPRMKKSEVERIAKVIAFLEIRELDKKENKQ